MENTDDNKMVNKLISFLNKNYGYDKNVLFSIIKATNLYTIASKLLKAANLQQYHSACLLKLQQHKRNEIFLSEIRKFIHKCEEYKLKPVFLKGLFLAADIYQDIDTKLSSDIDILIQPEDILTYKNILNENGYHMKLNYDISEVDKDKLLNDLSIMHIVFYKKINNMTVTYELHGSIMNPSIIFNDISNDFYNNSCSMQMFGLNVNVLSIEYNLVFLMLHFFKHLPVEYFQNMIFGKKTIINISKLHDIALLIDKYGEKIDWNKIIEISKKMQVVLYIYMVSKYVNEIYDNIINHAYIKLLEDNKELSYMISGDLDSIGLGKFQWLFNQTIYELQKLTITDLISGILPDAINLVDIAYDKNPKNVICINNGYEYINRDYIIDVDYGSGITKQANISLNTKFCKERLDIELNVHNKKCCPYKWEGLYYEKDSIEIIIIKEKMIVQRMFTLAIHEDKIKVIVSSHNCNEIIFFEHSEIITKEEGFILKLYIPWDMIGINLDSREMIPLSIAVLISNPLTEKFLQGHSLFGCDEDAWEFKSLGFMQLVDDIIN